MGTRATPPYTNIQELAERISENKKTFVKLLKRILDNIFMVVVVSTKLFHTLFEKLVNPPKIKLTISHTSLTSEESSMK